MNEIIQWAVILWMAYVVYNDDQATAQIRIGLDNLQEKIRAQNKSMAGKVDELVELIKRLTGNI